MSRQYGGVNLVADKVWEEEAAQKLLMRRMDLQITKDHGWVQHGDYNQASVAKKIGVTPVCLHNWEYGKTTPNSWTVWKKWAKILDIKFEINLIEPVDKSQEVAEIIQRNFK